MKRWKIVEIRKSEKGCDLLTLECGHVVERWFTFPFIGKFVDCERCALDALAKEGKR